MWNLSTDESASKLNLYDEHPNLYYSLPYIPNLTPKLPQKYADYLIFIY